jgi:NADH-quinone oxidoreductase subunit A
MSVAELRPIGRRRRLEPRGAALDGFSRHLLMRRPDRCGGRSRVLAEYLPILIFLGVSTVMGLLLLALGTLLGPRRPDAEKLSPYECGFEAFEDARLKFDVRFYLVAILFIIFDLEIAFLFPWAVVFRDMGPAPFIAMTIFLGVLVIGFIYEWKKGALEWE